MLTGAYATGEGADDGGITKRAAVITEHGTTEDSPNHRAE